MLFGTGRELITPPFATRLGGYSTFHGKEITGIHDDIYVKTALIEDGGARVALIAVDLLFHDFELTEEIRRYAKAEYGIETNSLILGYSHTHSAPSVRGYDPGQQDDRYEEFLLERIKQSIDRSVYDLKPGSIEYGSATGDWNINRRLLRDGQMMLAPNPNGPVDPTIRFIVLRQSNGSIGAILSSYGCHPVSFRDRTLVSADYPGELCRKLETTYYGATALFFQGCGGNSRPRMTAKSGEFVACTYDEASDMGTNMARAVERSIERGQTHRTEPSLASIDAPVRLDLNPYERSVFESEIAKDGNRKIHAKLVLDSYDNLPPHIDLPGGIIRLAPDLSVGWMGGEICYEVKRILEPIFAPGELFFVGYADATAYIPSDALIREGGYEAEGSTIEYCLKGPIALGVDARVGTAFSSSAEDLANNKEI